MDQLIADLQPGVLSELVAPLRQRLRERLESGEHTADDIAQARERSQRRQPRPTFRERLRRLCGLNYSGSPVLLFNPTRARWVSRETRHPKQDGKLQLDGSYLLKFPYSREPELVMDVLKYGADVRVLAHEA